MGVRLDCTVGWSKNNVLRSGYASVSVARRFDLQRHFVIYLSIWLMQAYHLIQPLLDESDESLFLSVLRL